MLGTERNIRSATATGQVTFQHQDMLRAMVWSPDSRTFATGSVDSTLRITCAKTGTTLSRRTYARPVAAIAWSPCGTWCAVGSMDGTLEIVARDQDDTLLRMPLGGQYNAMAWSQDGSMLAAGGLGAPLHIVDVASGQSWVIEAHPQGPEALSWAANNRDLLTISRQGELCLVDTRTNAVQQLLQHCSPHGPMGWSADNTQIAATRNGAVHGFAVQRDEADDEAPLTQIPSFVTQHGSFESRIELDWRPSGVYAVPAPYTATPVGNDSKYYLQRLLQQKPHTWAWSPNRRRCAASTWDGGVRIFSFEPEAIQRWFMWPSCQTTEADES